MRVIETVPEWEEVRESIPGGFQEDQYSLFIDAMPVIACIMFMSLTREANHCQAVGMGPVEPSWYIQLNLI
jgi:hypothetical protein